MAEKIESDTARKLHEAHRKGDAEEIDRLQAIYEEEVRQRIEAVRVGFDVLKQEQQAAQASGKVRTGGTQRYKTFISLYREAVALSKEISAYKKLLREGEHD